MSSVSPESSASNAGRAVEVPKFPFSGGLVPSEMTDLQASLLMRYYDACIAVAGFGGNSPGGSSVSVDSGLTSASDSSVVSVKTSLSKKRRLRKKNKAKRLAVATTPVAAVEHLSAVKQGSCYEKMLLADCGLGQWPTVEDVLRLPGDKVRLDSELSELSVQRVAPGVYHVGSVSGPSLLAALAVTVLANRQLVDGSASLANRLYGVAVPETLRKFPLSLTDVLGGKPEAGFPDSRKSMLVDFGTAHPVDLGFLGKRTSLSPGSHALRVINPRYGYSCIVFDKPVDINSVYPRGALVGHGLGGDPPGHTRCLLFSGEGEVRLRLFGIPEKLEMRCLFSGETDLFGIASVPEVLAVSGLLGQTVEYAAEDFVVMVSDIRYNESRMQSDCGANVVSEALLGTSGAGSAMRW